MRRIVQHIKMSMASIKHMEWMTQAYGEKTQGVYRLPFEGTWYVKNGGISNEEQGSLQLSRRFGYTFCKVSDQRLSYKQQGLQLEDYICYNQPVVAAAKGRVVEIGDGIADAPIQTSLFGKRGYHKKGQDIRGNYILIQHEYEEYSLVAYLKQGSICVKVGEYVKAGQTIARCGNSGWCTEPQLYFQVQKGKDFYTAQGRIIDFNPPVQVEVRGRKTQLQLIGRGQCVVNIQR